MDVYVCANLPYYITLAGDYAAIRREVAHQGITVMVQKRSG